MILTPTLPDNKNNDDSHTKMNNKKIRFRLRLVFGVQFDPSMRHAVERNTGWIPSARKFGVCSEDFYLVMTLFWKRHWDYHLRIYIRVN